MNLERCLKKHTGLNNDEIKACLTAAVKHKPGTTRNAAAAIHIDGRLDELVAQRATYVKLVEASYDEKHPGARATAKKARLKAAKPTASKVTTLGGRIKAMNYISFKGFKGEVASIPWQTRAKIIRKSGTPWDIVLPTLIDEGYVSADEDLLESLRTNPKRLGEGIIGEEAKTDAQKKAQKDLGPEIYEAEEPPPGEYETVKAQDLPEGKALTIIDGNTKEGWDVYKVVDKDPFGITLEDGTTLQLNPLDEVQVLKETAKAHEPIDDKGGYVDWAKPKLVEKDGLTQEYFATYSKGDIFKAWKTKAAIERLQANIGENILTLQQEDYGHQPKGKGAAVGKSKQMGFNFGDPKQKRLFDSGKVSEYINNKENWNEVRESDPTKTPPVQLRLTFGKPTDTSGDLRVAQRVRMETTGRLDAGYSKIHTAADAASLLSQFSKAAQENLFTIAVDKTGKILEVHRFTKGIKDASYFDLVDIAGRVYNIPGVSKVYSVHNHPSGSKKASLPDLKSHRALVAAFNLKKIDTVPIIMVQGEYITFSNQYEEGRVVPPKKAVEGRGVPVKERYLDIIEAGFDRPEISSSDVARTWLQANVPGQEGILMLSTANTPVGFMPWPKGKSLKNAAVDIISKFEQHNVSAAIITVDKPLASDRGRTRFLKNLIDATGASVTFHELLEAGVSAADRGTMIRKRPDRFADALIDLDSSETLFALGEKSATVESVLRDIERGHHDYIEKGHPSGVQGVEGAVYRKPARIEAAEQIATLYADRFDGHQTIVTIADAQQWLTDHRLPRVSKNHEISKNLRRLIKKQAYQELSIFDRIRVAAQLERPLRTKDYNPKIRPKANAKTGGSFRSQQPTKTEGSGIMAADTVAGCDHFCYECYGLKGAAQGDINHQHAIHVKLVGLLHTGETLRIGEKGDPSKNWAHTHEQVNNLIARSQKRGHKVSLDDVFYITKLLNLNGFDANLAKNIQITLDPMYPDHMRRTMANAIRIKAAHPDVSISARIRSLVTDNADLNKSMQAGKDFATDLNFPVLETRMRFIRAASFQILELDNTKYKWTGNQFKTKETVLKDETEDYHVCDAKDEACPGCKNCLKMITDRDPYVKRQAQAIKKLGIDAIQLSETEIFDPVGLRSDTGKAPKFALGERAKTFDPRRALNATEIRNLDQTFDFVDQAMRFAGMTQTELDRVSVELKNVIDLRGKSVEQTIEQWAASGKNADIILGATTMNKLHAVVELSLEQDLNSMEKTAYHESLHIMARWVLGQKKYDQMMKFYKGNEEMAADAFADFISGKKSELRRPVGAVRRMFNQLKALLQKLGNLLRGNGFARPEDIFEGLRTGQYRNAPRADQATTIAMKAEELAQKWYSQMVQHLGAKLPGSGTPEQMLKTLDSWAQKGQIKAEELKWSGLIDWLESKGTSEKNTLTENWNNAGKKVTKQEILDYLAENHVVVEEVEKGQDDEQSLPDEGRNGLMTRELGDDGFWHVYDGDEEITDDDQLDTEQAAIEIETSYLENEVDNGAIALKGGTKYADRQMAGGKNYKELLLTLPSRSKTTGETAMELFGKNWNDLTPREVDAVIQRMADTEVKGDRDFTGSHFDEPNILAHIRFNERTGPNGERILFLEEIQSDLHQTGRAEGYRKKKEFEPFLKEAGKWGVRDKSTKEPLYYTYSSLEIAKAVAKDESGFKGAVPDAPWKKSWPLKSVQRMVRYAAENGFDSIGWTPGIVQVERYDLSKQVDKISVYGRTDAVTGEKSRHIEIYLNDQIDPVALGVNNDGMVDNTGIERLMNKPLSRIVGKEMSKKIMEGSIKAEYAGEDLKIGGEGLIAFYDEMLPKMVGNYFGKKAWGGAKVGTVQLARNTGEIDLVKKMRHPEQFEKEQQPTVWELPITPEMRTKALTEGMSLFKAEDLKDAVDAFEKKTQAELGLKSFDLYVGRNGTLNLSLIEVEKGRRKQGIGSQAMAALTDFADKHGLRVFVNPGQKDDVHGTTSRNRLKRFYKRFGFVENKGRNKDFRLSPGMYRIPVEKTDTLLRMGKKPPGPPPSDVFSAHLPPGPAERIRKAKLGKASLRDRFVNFVKEVYLTFKPGNMFPHLRGPAYAQANEILRNATEINTYSKWKAVQELREILNPETLSTAQYDLFSLKLIMDDMLYDIETEGRPLYDWQAKHGELPFGFEDAEQVRDAIARIDTSITSTPSVKDALKRRQTYMHGLRRDLVDAKLLKEEVLEDPRYFHHQVLEYANLKFGVGTGSRDFRVKKKGYQIHRLGSIKDYNTQYAEAEFEVIAQGISQLEMKKNIEEIDDAYNIIGKLRAKARQTNYVGVVGGPEKWARLVGLRNKKAYLVGDGKGLDGGEKAVIKDLTEQIWALDPTMPFRAKIAMGFSKLAKTAMTTLSGSRYDMEIDMDDMAFSDIARMAEDGNMGAAIVLKAVSERKQYMKDVLGPSHQTWQTMMENEKPIEGSEGYTDWVPKPGSAWYMTNSLNDKLIEQLIAGERELTEADVKQVMARGYDAKWVIPVELAATLDGADFMHTAAENVLGKASEQTLNMWKRWILINPMRVLKYNLNNMSGDLDITLAYEPRILKYFKQAAIDLHASMKGRPMGKEVKAEIDIAMRDGVIGSGMTVHDIPDIKDLADFERLMVALQGEKKNAIHYIKKFWNTSKEYTTWRENILRLAAYRHFKEQIKAGKKVYGVSDKAKVDTTTSANRRAALLARELIGDYGNLSKGGQWLRRKAIPFYSWMEINAPRYWRLFKNIPIEGEASGRRLRVGGVMLKKGAVLTFKASMLFAAIQAYNRVAWPDEEEELGASGRRQMHLILGRNSDGTIRTVRIQGALSDALAWVGLEDIAEDVRELATGKKTVGDQAAEMAMAPAQRFTQGIRPDVKMAFELASGKSFYPDFTKPRIIRDKTAHAARMFSLDAAWRRLSDKPTKEAGILDKVLADLERTIIYTSDPGEASYHDTRSMVFKYLETKNIERSQAEPTNRSNALYYYRQAIKYGDGEGARKYLAKYLDLGGTWRGLRTSIKRAHPLAAIPKKERVRFTMQLKGADRQTVNRATRWYQSTYLRDN